MPATAGSTPVPAAPADLALVRALRAWGQPGAAASAVPGLLGRFSPAYRDRLTRAWAGAARVTPEVAWQTLLRDQAASARFDPARVHPTWRERILGAESPAVRRVVTDPAPDPNDPPSAAPTGTAHPAAVAWAMTLWAERLVGDVAPTPDDPPVILALATLSFRDLVRLARVLGQVKQAFASADIPVATLLNQEAAPLNATDRVRIAYFRRTIARPDARLIPLARADCATVAADDRRRHAAVGLITLARLLKGCDAHRARWAIQHLPYSIARTVGTLGGGDQVAASGLPSRAIRAWESWILEAAWARLLGEGRFAPGGAGGRP